MSRNVGNVRGQKAKASTVRFLRPGETPPEGVQPARYKNSAGYVRLRWRVAPREYVEVLEHRFVMGAKPGQEVHHKNHVRDDNRPENLELVTSAEHGERHRSHDHETIIELYLTGLSTPQVGARVGLDPSTVWRVLDTAGVPIRPGSGYNRLDLDTDVVRRLHLGGVRSRAIAAALGVSATCVDRRVRELGLTPHRGGRPTDAERARARALLAEVSA